MNEQTSINEEVENFEEAMLPLEDKFLNSSLIQDNKIIFEIDSKILRARMPNQYEQSLSEQARNDRQIELLKSDKAVSEKSLIAMLKKTDVIDIDELNEQKTKISKKLTDVFISLATRFSSEKDVIEKLKFEAETYRNEMRKISIIIANHLSSSIETQEEKAYIECLTSLCIEKCVGDDVWERKWETFDDFKKEEITITGEATSYMTWLILNTRG